MTTRRPGNPHYTPQTSDKGTLLYRVQTAKSMAPSSTSKYDITDIGVPMFPSGYARLDAVDLKDIKIPFYSKKNFFWIVNKLKYKGFRGDLNDLNKGAVLGRQVTEAAWLRVLIRSYKKWDPKELSKKFPGTEMKEKKRMLQEALFEVSCSIYMLV